MSEIKEFNPYTLADQIRERVRQQIVSVIPDQQVDDLIKKEWEAFFTPPSRSSYSYNNKPEDSMSPFQVQVRKYVNEYIAEKIQTAVKEEMQKYSEVRYAQEGRKYIEEFVKGYAPMALAGLSEFMVQQSLNQLANNNPNFRQALHGY